MHDHLGIFVTGLEKTKILPCEDEYRKDHFSEMRIFITLSLVVVVVGHPAHERSFPSNVYHKRSVQADGKEINIFENKNANEKIIHAGQAKKSAHEIEKRDAEDAVHSIEKRQVENTNDTAENGAVEQVAYSNEGAVARQGVNGQYVYASDYGGPIVQIEQHVYKSSCCYAGSTCPCSQNGTAPTPGP
ncbi:uncharacterized protein [Macrobrachium rosenbergii]|uniref:uncharacterized protein n=1 Tax=Macrobrachium rosenbergii TaxID=79674 RepID=UPI0034D67A46